MTPLEEYKALSEKIRACTKCDLCATRYQVVVDRGNPESRLMLIGEAPGANEDAQGEAFVGAAGQLLDELLKEAGITDFLIINVLKCRPPNNKFPGDSGSEHKEEIVNECLPWLDAQIALVKPRAIILVGHKAASWTLFRGKPSVPPMKDLIGKWFRSGDYRGVEFFVMYHTSYLLRTKNMDKAKAKELHELTVSTMESAKTVIDGELPDGEPVQVSAKKVQTDQMKFF